MSIRQQAINRYELWLAAVRRSGEPRVTYACPHCKHSLVTLKPAAGVTWDSLSTCPYCGGMCFKQIGTNHKGKAVVTTNICEV
jgi:hypothetical protein